MLVSLLVVGGDTRRLHLDVDARILRRLTDADRPRDVRKLAPDLREHVPRAESDDRMRDVEVVRALGWDRHPFVFTALRCSLLHPFLPLLGSPWRGVYLRVQTECKAK